jgi:hypothetical protein
MLNATAGSLIGIGEIILLPLDVLKIKMQTNPDAFRSRGFFRIVADEGMGLYRGAGWTAARNAPGSFALFGGSAWAKESLFKLEDYNVSWRQSRCRVFRPLPGHASRLSFGARTLLTFIRPLLGVRTLSLQ